MLGTLRYWLKVITYSEMSPILKLGKKRALQEADVLPLPDDYKAKNCNERFGQLPTTGKWALIGGLGKGLGGLLVGIVALVLLITISSLIETYTMKKLLEAISGLTADVPFRDALVLAGPYAAGFAVFCALVSLIIQYYIHALVKGEMLIINSLNDHIYRHALTLSAKARQQKSVGDLVNLMGTDSDQLAEIYSYFAELLYSVIITGIVFWFSYELVGLSAIWGVLLTISISPLAAYSAKVFVRYDDAIMAKRDERVSLMSQILNGIRVVKYFGWEQHFAKEVDAVRHQEMALRRRFVMVRVLTGLIWTSCRLLGVVLVIGLEIYNGRDLSAVWVFPLLSIYGLLIHPYTSLSNHISGVSSGLVSAQRIIDFLNLPSRDVQRLPLAPASIVTEAAKPRTVLKLEGLTIAYGDEPAVIGGLSLTLTKGAKVAVVGKVGAGKSSLLATILGEIPAKAGQVSLAVDAKLGYSSQHSFIQTGTVADNIRFGAPDGGDLSGVIAAAGMTDDLLQLADGAETEIGENGINLSGGQKQRLSLARVAYADPELILLDDPLSAVDPDMEDHLAEQLIWGRWQDKTILMTSHRLGHLAKFDQVLFLTGEGRWHLGSYDELLAQLPEFRSWVAASERAERSRHEHQKQLSATAVQAKADRQPSGVRAVADEDRVEGQIGLDVYGKYLSRMGGRDDNRRMGVFAAMVISLAAATAAPTLFDYWLSILAASEAGKITIPLLGSLPWQSNWLVPSLLSLVAFILVAMGLQSGYWAVRSLIAGRDLHDEAFSQVVTAPVAFFDKNPVGRVLNRFSRDVDVVENNMAINMEEVMVNLALAFVGLGVVGLAMPMSLLTLLPIGYLLYHVQDVFRASSREIKRLYSISRSPRFAHFKETLEGTATIRAFAKEQDFYRQYVERIEKNQTMLLGQVLINRWFSVRVPFMGTFYTLVVTVLIVYLTTQHGMTTALAGFVLLSCLSIWGNISRFVRAFKDLESSMTSVERLATYGKLPAEPQVTCEPYADVAGWQRSFAGNISFDDVWLRYEPGLPDVLKGLSFTIAAGQKVGIIGRTGAGKSTVFASLYRFVRPYKGTIAMDGVPIDSIPLKALRSQLAIIPQDPTLFRGTLRSNLDRFDAFDDGAIWQALAKVDLADAVKALPGQLEAAVVENGANFSGGERQLLCLARAILLDTKVIILDEATASVDILTDEKIQRTISEQFAHKTVLIIAHRLATVADCDLVIELKHGAVHRMMPGSAKASVLSSEFSPKLAESSAAPGQKILAVVGDDGSR